MRILLALLLSGALHAEVRFNRDIRPIMAETCFRCHGPDKSSRMAGMRLDIREEALKPTASGATPVVPGDPEKSAIVQRVFAAGARVMPPAFVHKELTDAQKQTIKQWVAEGARYEGHWAYQPLEHSALHSIDEFIRERPAREGLKPLPEADRRTLIRRVTLDLNGLPPTPEEIAAFLKDTSPNAYDKVVDRLLSSPRYAEQQTMHWLDVVRYADTSGFHGDNAFPAWPYRDYVLRAFRDNKPFDQFTREQLAGDLMPNATLDRRVASAYNRLNRTSAEGGLQPKEYLAKYAADRVRTTVAVWMGSTLGCAECHDHKFDPFTSRDFYSMKAFFADLKETGLVPDRGRNAWGSQLGLPTPEQQKQLDQIQSQLAQTRAPAPAPATGKRPDVRELAWKMQRPISARSSHGATLKIYNDEPVEYTIYDSGNLTGNRAPGNGLVVAGGPNPDNETYTVTLQPGPGTWTALGIEFVQDEGLPGIRLARGADRVVLTEIEAEAGQQKLTFSSGASNLNQPAPEYPPLAAFDGNPKTGWGVATYNETSKIFLALRFAQPVTTAADTVMTVRLHHDSDFRRAVTGRFRLALTSADYPWPDADATERARIEMEIALLQLSIPHVMVSEAVAPTETRILARANWMDDSGDIVQPAIPAFLGKLDTAGRRATRLDLANWLVAPENPLTARVQVNRLWRQFFATGISKALDDFGSQGEWPTHPELLDWLASEFKRDWDVRHIIRLIVTSQTYRQSSLASPQLEERDPDNRLLARQSRFRVDAEMVRDIALSVSGLLVEKFGGPSAKPYQPDGYLATMNFPKREYSASHGEDLYRRGVYTFWQRSFLHPSLVNFDAPTREECTINRSTSNTPLQALDLLNDPIYVEAARVFAAAMLKRGVDWGFERALDRAPTVAEHRILNDLYAKSPTEFRRAPAGAEELIHTGEAPVPPDVKPVELAAMTTVARAILNLHETITRN